MPAVGERRHHLLVEVLADARACSARACRDVICRARAASAGRAARSCPSESSRTRVTRLARRVLPSIRRSPASSPPPMLVPPALSIDRTRARHGPGADPAGDWSGKQDVGGVVEDHDAQSILRARPARSGRATPAWRSRASAPASSPSDPPRPRRSVAVRCAAPGAASALTVTSTCTIAVALVQHRAAIGRGRELNLAVARRDDAAGLGSRRPCELPRATRRLAGRRRAAGTAAPGLALAPDRPACRRNRAKRSDAEHDRTLFDAECHRALRETMVRVGCLPSGLAERGAPAR